MADDSMEDRKKRAIRAALFTVLAGPPIGCLLFFGGVVAFRSSEKGVHQFDSLQLVDLLDFTGVVTLFSYIFAGLPVLIAASVIARDILRFGNIGYIRTTFIAVASTLAGTLLLVGVLALGASDGEPKSDMLRVLTLFIPLSAASALVCRWLMDKFGVLPPDSGTSLAGH